jgi:hypothetical protein
MLEEHRIGGRGIAGPVEVVLETDLSQERVEAPELEQEAVAVEPEGLRQVGVEDAGFASRDARCEVRDAGLDQAVVVAFLVVALVEDT